MGILSAIFGSSKNTETLVDGAVKGIDKIVFTEEEKSDARAKASEWFLRYLEASQPQNVSRRLIAIVVSAVWAFFTTLTGLTGLVETYFAPELKGAAFLLDTTIKLVMPSFGIIVGFYFIKQLVTESKK